MEDNKDLIMQLFTGKVSEIIGFEKTVEILKESKEQVNSMLELNILDTAEKRNIFNEGYSLGLKTGKRQSIKK